MRLQHWKTWEHQRSRRLASTSKRLHRGRSESFHNRHLHVAQRLTTPAPQNRHKNWFVEKGETSETWLQGADWVVDAIDNIPTKVDLLAYCHRNNLKVFSSMGAGAKCDPTRCQIADISNTYEDPLAKQIRVRLRKMGITHGIPYVESDAIFRVLF